MFDISKKDWELFKEKLPNWQEAYIDRRLTQYGKKIKEKTPASIRLSELEKMMKEDKKNPGISMRLSKKDAVWDIMSLIQYGVINLSDLDDFSKELYTAVSQAFNR